MPYYPLKVSDKRCPKLQSGDVVYFVEALNRRTSNEIVGHLGIIKIHNNQAYLLHTQ
ncbi:MAG: hypothetical protein HQL05_04060 [Nitrospirae bacterium]|uniref:hypothetical protein n=1 Tax=Candidatus Magnetobacterium casense TaxID=1455061 RepID=UPI0012DF6789|nr:hypothetical protein [Candidatus Magnetobacterium casensis]MBF0336984.1 hypothetical protein [Nitrospirota bacterium]